MPPTVSAEQAIIGSHRGLSQYPANKVSPGHKSVANCLTTDVHSIQIPHPLSVGTGILKVGLQGPFWGVRILGRLWSFEELLLIYVFSYLTNPSSNVALTHALKGPGQRFHAQCQLVQDRTLLRKYLEIGNYGETAKIRFLKVRG